MSGSPKASDVPRKRKVAVVCGYLGTPFHGLQKNVAGNAVENTLEHALYTAGMIRESNYGDLGKIGWSRASRTDKGVHSTCTVVSAKLVASEDELADDGAAWAARVNAHLPDTVRVFACVPVTKGFRARSFCEQRAYTYYVPEAFLTQHGATAADLDSLLQAYVGRHNFHNFTPHTAATFARMARRGPSRSGRSAPRAAPPHVHVPREARRPESFISAQHHRRIAACGVLEGHATALCGADGARYVPVGLRGESFLYHQIRHMVGAVCAVVAGRMHADTIDMALHSLQRFPLPLAPAAPLTLRDAVFFHPRLHKRMVELQSRTHAAMGAFARDALQPHIHSQLEATGEWALFEGELASFSVRGEDERRAQYRDELRARAPLDEARALRKRLSGWVKREFPSVHTSMELEAFFRGVHADLRGADVGGVSEDDVVAVVARFGGVGALVRSGFATFDGTPDGTPFAVPAKWREEE